jgi:ATP-dependent DNA helicase RecG
MRIRARIAGTGMEQSGRCMTAAPDPIGPLTLLPGVGPAKAERLARAGIGCLRDLLFVLPRRLVVWPAPLPAGDVPAHVGEDVRVAGTVHAVQLARFGGRRSVVRVTLQDAAGGRASGVWFNQPWMRDALERGAEVELYGRVVEGRAGPALQSPRIGQRGRELPPPGTLEPEYVAPVGGISATTLGALCASVVEAHAGRLGEHLPDTFLADHDLPALPVAVAAVHAPRSAGAFEAGRRRLALEPLLAVQAHLFLRRAGRRGGQARAARVGAPRHRELLGRFPFRFTEGQLAVVAELRRDLARRTPMRRLLQGDVGAGKTALAAYAALAVVESDGQVALMAPTELLAEQHEYGLRALLRDAGVEAGLLTGSLPRDERRRLLERLARGELQVVFGTHALFSQDVVFRRLDLAVIDEQQRFGVDQRGALAEKGDDVHLLLMTATPIPRTLAMTLYGDLDVSTLRGAPPGRGELRTRWVRGQDQRRVPQFLVERLEAGEQVYWVCPRIGSEDDDGENGTASAEKRFAQLCAKDVLARYGVELVHGRVPAEERAYRLDRFRRGEVGMLVATTVIEVGVDVPSATVMVIENAERLGLAQLHQLRGRVGRGAADSWCLLYGNAQAAERFELLEASRDGFLIAEEDLRRRGMGDLAGLRQSGANSEGLDQDPERDLDLLLAARELVATRPDIARRYGAAHGPLLAP